MPDVHSYRDMREIQGRWGRGQVTRSAHRRVLVMLSTVGIVYSSCSQRSGAVPVRRSGAVAVRRSGAVPVRRSGAVPVRRSDEVVGRQVWSVWSVVSRSGRRGAAGQILMSLPAVGAMSPLIVAVSVAPHRRRTARETQQKATRSPRRPPPRWSQPRAIQTRPAVHWTRPDPARPN